MYLFNRAPQLDASKTGKSQVYNICNCRLPVELKLIFYRTSAYRECLAMFMHSKPQFTGLIIH